jgi:uncharacterized protein (TIGR03435 family)
MESNPENMSRNLASGIIGIVCMLGVQAQPMSAPAFEVASIKASKADDFRRVGMKFLPGGRFLATNYPLQVLIAGAYNIPYQSSRLTGGPAWVRSDRYDIEARADTESIPIGLAAQVKRARMRLMLQKLLTDRFKLVIRRETQELPVYAIVVAKKGFKLLKAEIKEEDCFDEAVSCHVILGGQGHGMHGDAADISDLAVFVENYTDHPVINKTGIEGLFRIDTKGWVPLNKPMAPGAKAEDGSDLASLPSLFTVFGGLGLKLELERAPVEMFFIDHVERPSGN